MILSRWRPPEAPRPSRFTSRGTAALSWAAIVLFGDRAACLAGALALLEPGGRPLCTGQPGLRSITTVVPDQRDGYYLLARDERPELSLEEGADAFLVHLDPGLIPLPFGADAGSDGPCGALLLGGAGTQYAVGGAMIAPARLAVALQSIVDVGPDVSQIWTQAYDESGRPLFGADPVRVSTPRVEARFPSVLPDGAGGLFVAWNEDPVVYPSQLGDLFLQRFDPAGHPVWAARTRISGGIYGGASSPVMTPDGEEGVYLSFVEPRVEEYPDDYERIRVQRVDRNGALVWPPGGLTPWDGNRADDPVSGIASDGGNGAIIVFAADGRVRAQKMSPAGDRLWGRQGVVLSDPPDPYPTPVAFAAEPRIVPADDGGLYVTWTEVRESGFRALVARRLERDGRLPWPRATTLAVHGSGIWKRREAVLADGSLAVVWEDGRATETDPGDGTDVNVQMVDRRGRLKGPRTGLPLVAAPGGQQSPIVVRPGRPFATPPDIDASLPQALVFFSDGRLAAPEGSWPTAVYVAQVVAFGSYPQVDPVPTLTVR